MIIFVLKCILLGFAIGFVGNAIFMGVKARLNNSARDEHEELGK